MVITEGRFRVSVEGMESRAMVLGDLVQLPEGNAVVRVLNEVRDVVPRVERAALYQHLAASHEHRLRAVLRADDVTWCEGQSRLRIATEQAHSLFARSLVAVRAGVAEYSLGLTWESFEWLSRACGARERDVDPCLALACTVTRMLLG